VSSISGPKCRLCRREGQKLFLKGAKCFSSKCPVEKRPTPPGQHGQRRSRLTDFGVMLREKQKLRRIYGILEGQFRKYYEEAHRRRGSTGENLLVILETRLDNILYRLGFGASRAESRQLVSHRSVKVNGHIVNIPSYEVSVGDNIEVTEKATQQLRLKSSNDVSSQRGIPDWLEVDTQKMAGKLKVLPVRADLPSDIQEHLVVELYSK